MGACCCWLPLQQGRGGLRDRLGPCPARAAAVCHPATAFHWPKAGEVLQNSRHHTGHGTARHSVRCSNLAGAHAHPAKAHRPDTLPSCSVCPYFCSACCHLPQKDGSWTCKHGEEECAGNVQQLCVQKTTKPYNRVKWLLAFVLCNNKQGLDATGSFATASRCLQVCVCVHHIPKQKQLNMP